MSKKALIVTSTSCLDYLNLEEPSLRVIRMKILMGDETLNDYIDITTRAQIELRFLNFHELPIILKELNEVGITTFQTAGDNFRGVVTSALDGFSKTSKIDSVLLTKSIEGAQLTKFIGELPQKEKTIIGERGIRISGGQRQRIGIARALYKKPSIIIFDEATSALDYNTESNIMDLINNLNKDITIIIITHRTNTIEKCEKVYLVKDGKIFIK